MSDFLDDHPSNDNFSYIWYSYCERVISRWYPDKHTKQWNKHADVWCEFCVSVRRSVAFLWVLWKFCWFCSFFLNNSIANLRNTPHCRPPRERRERRESQATHSLERVKSGSTMQQPGAHMLGQCSDVYLWNHPMLYLHVVVLFKQNITMLIQYLSISIQYTLISSRALFDAHVFLPSQVWVWSLISCHWYSHPTEAGVEVIFYPTKNMENP